MTSNSPEIFTEWIQSAKRHIYCRSASLAPLCYKNEEVLRSFSSFARTHPQTKLFIIVENPKSVSNSHPLITLTQRLSSHCEVRTIIENGLNSDYYWASDHGETIIWHDEVENLFSIHDDRALTKSKMEEFQHEWQHNTQPSQELRRLYL